MHVCLCMGIVCEHFTAPVSDRVWGGLCGSESSTVQATDRLCRTHYMLRYCTPLTFWDQFSTLDSNSQWLADGQDKVSSSVDFDTLYIFQKGGCICHLLLVAAHILPRN